MYTMKQVAHILDDFAPPHLAESWDNVGLLIGDPYAPIQGVLCALDLNEEVVDEAISIGANCIVTHHPFLFKPIKHMQLHTPIGRIIKKLIKHDINVFAMHTNFDVTKNGINDWIAQNLKLENIQPLAMSYSRKMYKVVVYVPKTHFELVRNQIIAWNETTIGNYKGCTFASEGEGTFIPLEGSTPYLGKEKQLEKVNEMKLECMIDSKDLKTFVEQVKSVHPYEEIAYDVYELQHIKHQEGIGRWGICKEQSLDALIETLKILLGIPYVRVTTKQNQKITRIALCSGSGSSYIKEAAKVADVYITGDMTFHMAQDALSQGLSVIDVGHYASENIGMPIIQKVLTSNLDGIVVTCSQVDGEVFQTR